MASWVEEGRVEGEESEENKKTDRHTWEMRDVILGWIYEVS